MAKANPLIIAGAAMIILLIAGCSQQAQPPYSQTPETNTEPTNSTQEGISDGMPPGYNTPTEETMPQEGISIENYEFTPSTISIKKGTTVTWENMDSVPHTATSDDTFDSGTLIQGRSYSYTFNEPGTFEYICTIHPSMMGKVIVTG